MAGLQASVEELRGQLEAWALRWDAGRSLDWAPGPGRLSRRWLGGYSFFSVISEPQPFSVILSRRICREFDGRVTQNRTSLPWTAMDRLARLWLLNLGGVSGAEVTPEGRMPVGFFVWHVFSPVKSGMLLRVRSGETAVVGCRGYDFGLELVVLAWQSSRLQRLSLHNMSYFAKCYDGLCS